MEHNITSVDITLSNKTILKINIYNIEDSIKTIFNQILNNKDIIQRLNLDANSKEKIVPHIDSYNYLQHSNVSYWIDETIQLGMSGFNNRVGIKLPYGNKPDLYNDIISIVDSYNNKMNLTDFLHMIQITYTPRVEANSIRYKISLASSKDFIVKWHYFGEDSEILFFFTE